MDLLLRLYKIRYKNLNNELDQEQITKDFKK